MKDNHFIPGRAATRYSVSMKLCEPRAALDTVARRLISAPVSIRTQVVLTVTSHTAALSRLILITTMKIKAVPLHAMEALVGGRRYSFYSFTTSALDGGEWSASRPGHALPPGKGPPVLIGQEAGWASEPVWTQRIEEKSFAPAGDRTPIARSSSP
jgi:hypothetical protein